MENLQMKVKLITMNINRILSNENSDLARVIFNKKKYLLQKKIADKLVSIFGIFLLMPLFLIVGLIIKISAPKAPVFFKQIRYGKLGKPFVIYKFRTMYVGSEGKLEDLRKYNEVEGSMFKMKNDPRITKIGRILRKTSIDEFPQLFNVLKGEMSIIGPRPPLPIEVQEYSEYALQRLLVIPGCTGLWQVSGRNKLSFIEMVELDLTYIKKMSFKFDVKIFLKTIVLLIGVRDGH